MSPTLICICCDRLFFGYSICMLTIEEMLKKCTLEFLRITCPLGVFDGSRHLGYACWNCKKYLMKNKTPPLSLTHTELRFPVIPPELADLKMIEERFLAPRISFIQIRVSFVDTQKKLKGRIVNVPDANVESS